MSTRHLDLGAPLAGSGEAALLVTLLQAAATDASLVAHTEELHEFSVLGTQAFGEV